MSPGVLNDDEYMSVSEESDDGSISEHEEDDGESESNEETLSHVEPNPFWVVGRGLGLLAQDTVRALRGPLPSLEDAYRQRRAQMMAERPIAMHTVTTQDEESEAEDEDESEAEDGDGSEADEPDAVQVVSEGLRLVAMDTLEAFRGRQPSLREDYLRLRAQMMAERQNAFNRTPTQQARCRACAQQDRRSTP